MVGPFFVEVVDDLLPVALLEVPPAEDPEAVDSELPTAELMEELPSDDSSPAEGPLHDASTSVAIINRTIILFILPPFLSNASMLEIDCC